MLIPRRHILAALMLSLAPCASNAAAQTVVLVQVDKGERTMELIADDGSVRRYDIALGGQPVGHKRHEGDGRTPEGRYILDWRNADSAFYKSIHISYPDVKDRNDAAARGEPPGGMIMIHGQRNWLGLLAPFVQMFDWTDGCIAVSNSDMDEIWNLVKNGTPIEINP